MAAAKPKKSKDYSTLIGEKFGMLTITEILPRERDGRGDLKPPECLCECECGNKTLVRSQQLRNGVSKSCGRCKEPRPGEKFGLLTQVSTTNYQNLMVKHFPSVRLLKSGIKICPYHKTTMLMKMVHVH